MNHRRAYTTVSDKLPAINYKAMIFVEPSISEQGAYDAFLKAGGKPQNAAVAEAILKRRSTWGNRAEARKFFETRLPWKTWDPRVRELYMVSERCVLGRCLSHSQSPATRPERYIINTRWVTRQNSTMLYTRAGRSPVSVSEVSERSRGPSTSTRSPSAPSCHSWNTN